MSGPTLREMHPKSQNENGLFDWVDIPDDYVDRVTIVTIANWRGDHGRREKK
jgi:hypothetical protein